MANLDIFKDIAGRQAFRILSLCDRYQGSFTFGCFDRNYWHYKIIDLPNARYQEAMLYLALLYANNIEAQIYRNRKLLDFIKGALAFWGDIQNKDGSFNEVYPYERSFCATAFSTYAATESCIILPDLLSPDCLSHMEDAGIWMRKNANRESANQIAGSMCALYNIYILTKDRLFLEASEAKLRMLEKLWHSDGYFLEQGGYDIGYLSVVISYLAKYYRACGYEGVLKYIGESTDFINQRLDEYGHFSTSDTSRKTQYLYPYGFRIAGSAVINRIIKGLSSNRIVNPQWMDDRYCIYLSIDYLQTYAESRNEDDNA
jgi:hypothetical protein